MGTIDEMQSEAATLLDHLFGFPQEQRGTARAEWFEKRASDIREVCTGSGRLIVSARKSGGLPLQGDLIDKIMSQWEYSPDEERHFMVCAGVMLQVIPKDELVYQVWKHGANGVSEIVVVGLRLISRIILGGAASTGRGCLPGMIDKIMSQWESSPDDELHYMVCTGTILEVLPKDEILTTVAKLGLDEAVYELFHVGLRLIADVIEASTGQ